MPSKPVILSTLPLKPATKRRLEATAPGHKVVVRLVKTYTDTDKALDKDVEILFTNYAPTTLVNAPNLKWVQLASVGINHLANSPLLQSDDVVLTNARGTMSGPLAEFTLGAILSLARDFPKAYQYQQEHRWIHNNDRLDHFPAVEVRGKTLGLLGYGSVAQEVARLARGLGMKIAALATGSPKAGREKRYSPPELRKLGVPKPDTFHRGLESLPAILKSSDFIVNTLPLTPETRGLIGAKQIRYLRKDAFLINISRGFIIDETALMDALKNGRLAGALLDVFDQEPLPSDSPLYTTPRLVVTPHVSGVFADMVETIVALFHENLGLYLEGKPLFNPVGRKRGY